jgi:hypothetical protein
MTDRVVPLSLRRWCVLTPLAVRLSLLDSCSPDVVLSTPPLSSGSIFSIFLLSRRRFPHSQAEWCRDGREKDDLVIRCSWEVISLGVQPEGGKSHTGSSNPMAEYTFMHVLTVFLCGCVEWIWVASFSLTGGTEAKTDSADGDGSHNGMMKTPHNRNIVT